MVSRINFSVVLLQLKGYTEVGAKEEKMQKNLHIPLWFDRYWNMRLQLGTLTVQKTSITRSHGSVTSVVRATREVNGRRQIYPSHHTHTP